MLNISIFHFYRYIIPVFCIFATVLKAVLCCQFYRNTKRYARLVDGNVRNFRRQVSIVVRALCVGCYSYIFLQRFFSRPPSKDVVYQCHASFCMQYPSRCRENVKPYRILVNYFKCLKISISAF